MSVKQMNNHLRIAIAQCVSWVGAIETNLENVDLLCRRAKAEGADFVLFPEAHTTGYSYRDLRQLVEATAQPMSGLICRRLREIAIECGLVAICGMFEREEERIYNTQAVAFPDGRIEAQRKGVAASAESEVICLEQRRRVFEWKGVRFGIAICADNSLPGLKEQISALDVSLLFHPCAGRLQDVGPDFQPALDIANEESFKIGLKVAKEMNVTYCVANTIGFSNEDYYPGNSWIISPDGASYQLPGVASPSLMLDEILTASVFCPNHPPL